MSSNTRCSGLSERQRGIQRLVWPARSLDLNLIENVWDALGRQVAGQNYPPTNKNTFIRALTEEWDKLAQQLLYNVVQKLVRCSACQVSPEHILDCLGLSKQDLDEDPLMVLDFLRVNEIMDLA
ncbi:hypothetical protein TNCV_1695321 [Trichonephila clavipes]|nr:hypothetical protein TNCV_1695321 [Trichonephila clavipes]